MIKDKRPSRPAECASCGEKHLLLQHCPKSGYCNWTRCKKCGSITAVIKGQLKAIAGKV